VNVRNDYVLQLQKNSNNFNVVVGNEKIIKAYKSIESYFGKKKPFGDTFCCTL